MMKTQGWQLSQFTIGSANKESDFDGTLSSCLALWLMGGWNEVLQGYRKSCKEKDGMFLGYFVKI